MTDPAITDPDHYRVLWENDRVRVLEYHDRPGDETHDHSHPDSVMITLSSFDRLLVAGDREVPVSLEAGQARWLDAQTHRGRNTGQTESHTIFVELKERRPDGAATDARLGPSRG